ncbi:MAG: hypothetical protein J6H18_05775, partial [Lachnospiraceae bacterium]|nr:hypothetical protein [Lachnospiraceae bacterium]
MRRSPSGGSAKGSGRTGAPQNHAPLVRDLILLFLIALAVLMFLSLFGIVGAVGRFFARLEFGLFGRTAYLFPFV